MVMPWNRNPDPDALHRESCVVCLPAMMDYFRQRLAPDQQFNDNCLCNLCRSRELRFLTTGLPMIDAIRHPQEHHERETRILQLRAPVADQRGILPNLNYLNAGALRAQDVRAAMEAMGNVGGPYAAVNKFAVIAEDKAKAEQRSRELLLSFLTPTQLKEYQLSKASSGYPKFTCVGSHTGWTWSVECWHLQGNTQVKTEDGKWHRFCGYSQGDHPDNDKYLSEKLWLETDELQFFETAYPIGKSSSSWLPPGIREAIIARAEKEGRSTRHSPYAPPQDDVVYVNYYNYNNGVRQYVQHVDYRVDYRADQGVYYRMGGV